MTDQIVSFFACAAVLCLLPAAAVAGPKTDIIELLNGDRITCEIRKLDRGKLTVKTDGVGTIAIEWDDIARISSPASYDVELESGRRLFGTLVRADAGSVDIRSSTASERVPLSSIVRIAPVERTFWRRLDGSVDAGFSFTEANVETQWTSHFAASYRSQRWLSSVTGDSLLTSREDSPRQTRNNALVQTERFWKNRWSTIGLAQFQQNEELSLQLRTALGAVAKRVFVQSSRTGFGAGAGAVWTSEQYSDTPADNIAEAVLGADWEWFTYDGRSTNFSFSAFTFFALRNDSRTRVELNSSFKTDIVGDLYWSINFFESFNSHPPAGQKRNDSGVSATIGWSF